MQHRIDTAVSCCCGLTICCHAQVLHQLLYQLRQLGLHFWPQDGMGGLQGGGDGARGQWKGEVSVVVQGRETRG